MPYWVRSSVLVCMLAFLVSTASLAGETPSAMLFVTGQAWLNGSAVPRTAALFSGDLVQTPANSLARINATGSTVLLLSNSLAKFQGPAIALEHGEVQVATSRGLVMKAGEITVTPKQSAWTEFQMKDVDGHVLIVARKGDLTVQDQQSTTTLAQGQETTRDETTEPEKKKHRKRRVGAAPGAGGGLLSSTPAIVGGAAVVGGITAWVLLQSSPPMSPSCPNNSCP